MQYDSSILAVTGLWHTPFLGYMQGLRGTKQRFLSFSNRMMLETIKFSRSSGGVVVKLVAYGDRGPGFDSWSRRYNF